MKKDYIFNTIAGLINAAEAVIMSMIITRTTGLTDAGYVTIAFAVNNLLLTLGKYCVYSFQVTDNQQEFSFLSYLETRIITTLAMLVALSGYLIYGRLFLVYSNQKLFVILFIGLIYAIESFENLIWAHCHHVGKLYMGAAMFIIRWTCIFISFGIALLITYNTSTALGISLVISFFVFILCCHHINRKLNIIRLITSNKHFTRMHFHNILRILIACFPQFLSYFLSFYIINSSKYAIEKFMNADTLACYGFVSMPVFAITLLNGFIYQPQLLSLTSDYESGNLMEFKAKKRRQYTVVIIITIVCIIGAYIVGIPFLSLLYHTDLNGYKPELLILLLGGGFLALSGYQTVLLTIMRKQKYLLCGYVPVSIIAFFFVKPIVKQYGTQGAAFSYLILILILSIIYEIFMQKSLVNDS